MIPALSMNTGATIPQIGFGTAPMKDDEVAAALEAAIPLGYRHIDTALRYGNETGVGEGIRRSGLDRSEFFVTTKLDGPYQGQNRALSGIRESLERLGMDYVDLLLIHWPLPERDEYVSTWKTFEAIAASGAARAIGVSNFKGTHLDRLVEAGAAIVPAVNQIQLNPGAVRAAQVVYDAEHGIITAAWSPLGAGRGLLDSPVLAEVGARHGKTPGQVVLRWQVQRGLVTIPRSSNPTRMAQNLDVFDFELDAGDLARIAELDRGPDAGVDSDKVGH